MFYHHYMYGPGFGLDGGLGVGAILLPMLSLVFWVLVIWLIIRLLSRNGHHLMHHDHSTSDPLEAAKMRYAKGEVTKAEFETIKKDLKD